MAWAKRRALHVDPGSALADLPASDGVPRGPVNCVVFSKDRAMQLDACLRSIEKFSGYEGTVVVIYKATTPAFAEGYRLLSPGSRVRLVLESDFRRDVIEAIDPEIPYTVFQVDDDVFFRAPLTAPVVPPGAAAFSLRLGTNTDYCYSAGASQAFPATASRGSLLAWNWMGAEGDFAYPMSLDGHFFRTSLILRMLSRLPFTNPNRLEEALTLERFGVPPLMLSFSESCVVSIPVNIVTSTHENRAGSDPALSPDALNARFLAGERIDLDAMDFSQIRGAHQEVQLRFRAAGGSEPAAERGA